MAKTEQDSKLSLLETVADHMNDAIMVAEEPLDDPEGPAVLLYVNRAFEKMTGYSAEEVIGKTTALLVNNVQDPEQFEALRKARRQRIPLRGLYITKNRAGEEYVVETDMVPLPDDGSGTHKFLTIRRDVTERERITREAEDLLEDSIIRYKNLFDVAQIGLSITSTMGEFLDVNTAFYEMFNTSKEEILKLKVTDLTHPEDRSLTVSQRNELTGTSGEQGFVEKRYLRPDGSVFWGRLNRSVITNENGQAIYIIGQLQDISQFKEVEKIKSEFVSVSSHELRTPLTSIKGALGLIVENQNVLPQDKQDELLKIAYSNTNRLLDLVNDILDFEKLDSNSMSFQFEKFDVVDLVNLSADLNKPYATENSASISVEVDQSEGEFTAVGDKERVAQVLTNLISNAAKFSPPGGVVTLSAKRLNGSARITVSDTGPGIEAQHRSDIFQPFTQIDSKDTRSHQGTGLGLSICKKIIDAHGGTIDFESQPGHGTTFYFDLPSSS